MSKKSIEKLLKDQKLLKHEQYQTEVREMLERMDVDPDEVLKLETSDNISKLTRAKALVDSVMGSELWEREDNGRYRIYAKITAITVMTASLGIMQDLGVSTEEPIPYYSGVSAWLDIPQNTLRYWWENRVTIMREQGSLSLASVQRSTLKNIELSEKFTDGLDLSVEEIKKMRRTPKGLLALLKVATQTMFNAKMWTTQAEVIATKEINPLVDSESESKHVGIVMPVPTAITLPPTKGTKKDVNDITDKK